MQLFYIYLYLLFCQVLLPYAVGMSTLSSDLVLAIVFWFVFFQENGA